MLVGDITYVHTREGFVYPAGREGAVCSKGIVGYAMARTHASRIGSKRSGEVAVRNCQPVKGVTFFHVESGDRSRACQVVCVSGLGHRWGSIRSG